jgi:hypothetical protein
MSFPQADRAFDVNMHNFKATVYHTQLESHKRLLIIFEDSRYATETVACERLVAKWDKRFGIRNCRESSYIYFRLYCRS